MQKPYMGWINLGFISKAQPSGGFYCIYWATLGKHCLDTTVIYIQLQWLHYQYSFVVSAFKTSRQEMNQWYSTDTETRIRNWGTYEDDTQEL